ncbi:MAG: helix-turn-helix transcriptional regulator [Betaproteobacteria bacterium]|nr:helix-turn-helix transcriptional regulator [Betaproteobacteria bacterium]
MIDHLSPREVRILSLLAEGMTAKKIGKELGIADSTVHNLLSPLYRKIGTRNAKAAAAYYLANADRLTTAPAESSAAWYMRQFVDERLHEATRRWLASAESQRPSAARLALCLMLALIGSHTEAEQEAAPLSGQEATAFYLFRQWQAGEAAALPMLTRMLEAGPHKMHYTVKLALFQAAMNRGERDLARDCLFDLYLLRQKNLT